MITFTQLGKMGRLGNQMFQIASTIGIAVDNDMDYGFHNWEYQEFFKNPLPSSASEPKVLYKEPNFHHSNIWLNSSISTNWDLEGYFQSWKYFEHCKELINYYFTPKYVGWTFPNHISIHIRRGDYLNKADYHTNLTSDYYINAMQQFPDEKFMIFSDDVDWCMEAFKDYDNCEIYTGFTDVDDLFTMSSCKGHIIANSSYSFWAAYLDNKLNKKIIYPKNWFANGIDSSDICPPEWLGL